MDDPKDTSPEQNKPGAPELARSIKPPSAPLVEDRAKGPIFRAEPSPPPVADPQPTSVPVESTSVPFDDDDEEEEAPDGPPMLDEHQARIEYLQSLRRSDKKKRKGGAGKIALIIFLVLLIVGGVGTSVYFMFHRSRSAPKQSLTVNQPQQAATDQTDQASDEQKQDEDQTQTPTVESKDYTSSTFNLSLKYPGDWTPLEVTDKLSFTSPVVQLTDANSQTTSGRIIVAVRQQQAKPAELSGGDPVAVLASEKAQYTKPSAGQRAETYLTYAQFVGTSIKGGLDAVYITGSYGYQYAQRIKLTDIATIKPLINVTFVSCADTACEQANQKPLTISSSAWKSDTTNRPAVETMLKSLSLN